jgi:hypothetical protein
MPVSAISVRVGFDDSELEGQAVVVSVVTDDGGRYRLPGLVPGRYHIVPGPVFLPKFFSDVARSDSPHVATVAAGAVVENIDFAVVRDPDRLPYASGRVMTVTGTIGMQRFGSAGGGVFVQVPNSDGIVTKWHFRDPRKPPGLKPYWWPGYDVLPYAMSPIADMIAAGETVTVSGTEIEDWSARTGLTDRALAPSAVTRGGR